MSSGTHAATTQSPSDNSDGIQLTPFLADDILPLDFAPPIGPELVSEDELPAAWAYKRFTDLDAKESYRAKLLQELTNALEARNSETAAGTAAALRNLMGEMAEQGAVVLADIVAAEDFLELVARYDEIMAQEGSGSFLHRFADLRRTIGLLTDPTVNKPLLHPLMIALISYAIGGPIRMVDARAKDAEPLSVLAQDNMLHIDNTPFNDEYKIIVTWRRGTAQGPAGQNFTFLPGTHQLARTCFVNEAGVPWSSENASIFTTADRIRRVFDAQMQVRGQDSPTVVEVTDSERPLSTVFAAGSLVHHRFRTATGNARSCVIMAFHRVADNPGRLVSDVEDSPDASLSELLTSGVPDDSYQQRFITTLCGAADEIAELLVKWKHTPARPVPLPLQEKRIDGPRFEEWISAATEAPGVQAIRNREQPIPYGEVLSREDFFDLIWRLMRFDKHGPLDLILYHDNREEPRKWARNLIREMSADRLHERLLGWRADMDQHRPADCLRPPQIHALISEVLETLPLDGNQTPPADWHNDMLGMSPAAAARSVKHLLEDLAEAVLRCEDRPAYLSTSLFAFWAVDTAYSLDGRRNAVVRDCTRRLLRHYLMLSLTSL
ncbi:hypothetical protein [Mycobacterium lacus]|uniref:Uncharacterized protein n=1 Tax=Mycobacterium lacus TaxID=169765 RepID=A0A1X1XMU9_9MYCO|nr:hypothetical protein [Mycobacterium lacus]MCV7122006.1 hypothetical protein [Mycobacterium lacus]ORW00176.1 hypothetical protein AWC15_08775 [Mycobacterium lacus]BBX98724.1 hypothetical protein MLAC_40180 [Mycobacterium lacus]